MDPMEVRLEDFLNEVGFGEVRFTIVDKRICVVPRQRIERPMKHGVRMEIVVDEPIRLKRD